jgi:lysophospholipase L1-like esterase
MTSYRQLQAFYANSPVAFRDIGPLIINGQAEVSEIIMPDGLHLNYAGYEVIGPELKNIIDEFWSQ